MDPMILSIIIGAVSLIVGVVSGKLLFNQNTKKQVEDAELQAQTILKEAELLEEGCSEGNSQD